MDNKKSMPAISPGKPIVVRMNGECEEFNINLTSLRKRKRLSDIIVTRWFDDSLSIESRTCCPGTDASRRRTNDSSLTPQQTEVLRHILNSQFPQK